MTETEQTNFLAVGLPEIPSGPRMVIRKLDTGRQAIATLRVMECDMLLAGRNVPDMSIWTLMKRIRGNWPKLKWAFVDDEIDQQDEIIARSLGASLILQQMPDSARMYELASSILRNRMIPVGPRVDTSLVV